MFTIFCCGYYNTSKDPETDSTHYTLEKYLSITLVWSLFVGLLQSYTDKNAVIIEKTMYIYIFYKLSTIINFYSSSTFLKNTDSKDLILEHRNSLCLQDHTTPSLDFLVDIKKCQKVCILFANCIYVSTTSSHFKVL